VRAFHNLDADWGASFKLSTRHFLDVLAGRESEEALTAQEGRRVIAFYNLFQRSNAGDARWRDSSANQIEGFRTLQGLSPSQWKGRLPSTPKPTLRLACPSTGIGPLAEVCVRASRAGSESTQS
jgi:hypothetical protein